MMQKDCRMRAALSHSWSIVDGQKASDPRALVSLLMGLPAWRLREWRRSERVRLSLFGCEDCVDVWGWMRAPDIVPEPCPGPEGWEIITGRGGFGGGGGEYLPLPFCCGGNGCGVG